LLPREWSEWPLNYIPSEGRLVRPSGY
jgi:hypothetical protein